MGDGVDGGALSGSEGGGSGVWGGVSAVLAVFGTGDCAVGGGLVGLRGWGNGGRERYVRSNLVPLGFLSAQCVQMELGAICELWRLQFAGRSIDLSCLRSSILIQESQSLSYRFVVINGNLRPISSLCPRTSIDKSP